MPISKDDARVILVDIAQQAGKHDRKHRDMAERGYKLFKAPLPVGDYILCGEKTLDAILRKHKRNMPIKKLDLLGTYKTTVDTKKGLEEVYQNIIGREHARFRDECILAQNNGIRLVVLVENIDGIRTLQDVQNWKNKRYAEWHRINGLHKVGMATNRKIPAKPPANSVTLMKAMITMGMKYGVKFQFCSPLETGQKIIEILESG